MSDPFGHAADSTRYDIDFAVPQVHRLRFTHDCFGDDFPELLELLPPSSHGVARVQVWIDQGLVAWSPALPGLITQRLTACTGVELVGPVETLPGGEVVSNDTAFVDRLLTSFNQHELDRRSYVLVIGGGAVLDTVGYAAAIGPRHSLNSHTNHYVSPRRLGVGCKECCQLVWEEELERDVCLAVGRG